MIPTLRTRAAPGARPINGLPTDSNDIEGGVRVVVLSVSATDQKTAMKYFEQEASQWAIDVALQRLARNSSDRLILARALKALPKRSVVAAGGVRVLLRVLAKLALEQAREPRASPERDMLASTVATLLWDLDVVTEDYVLAIAALLGTNWAHGQILGCVTAGLAVEKIDLRPVVPLLERCMLRSSDALVKDAAKATLVDLLRRGSEPLLSLEASFEIIRNPCCH